MTTNASRLGDLAAPLKLAGLSRLNISLDSLDRKKTERIARRDCFEAVMSGIDAATEAGFKELKFNAVVMRGVNDDELCSLARFAAERGGGTIRFIEFMPMGNLLAEKSKTVVMSEMLANLRKEFDLRPETENQGSSPSDPARNFRCRRSGVRVGFITSMSDHFCGSCNRMRLTSTGALRPCLHQDSEVDLREILRASGNDEQIAEAFRRAANLKWAGHRMNAFVPLYSRKEMIAIGG